MKKSITKLIAFGIIVSSIMVMNPISANATWRQDSNGWWNSEGSSWSVGWRQIDSKWYCFGQDGYMLHDTTIEGYKLGSDGAWIVNVPVASTTTINNETTNKTTVSTDAVSKANSDVVSDVVAKETTNTNNSVSSSSSNNGKVYPINPVRPADAFKDFKTKMTIFFNKDTGAINTIVTGVVDMGVYSKSNDGYLYNYIVVDFDNYLLEHASRYYIKGGQILNK